MRDGGGFWCEVVAGSMRILSRWLAAEVDQVQLVRMAILCGSGIAGLILSNYRNYGNYGNEM